MTEKWEQVGVIGVDAGLCWVGDPCYCVTPDCDEHPAATWSKFCDLIGSDRVRQFNFKMGHAGLGVAVSTGHGDGCYPVSVKRGHGGIIEAVMVDFTDDGDNDA